MSSSPGTSRERPPASTSGTARRWLLPLGGGLAAGFVAGLFGVGGGVLLVPVLVLLLHRSQHVAHATSLVAIVIPAISGATRFAFGDAVVWGAAVAIAAGALAGTQIGANLLHRVPERELRWLFAALLVAMSVRLLLAGGGGGEGLGLDAPTLTVGIIAAHVGVGLASGTASALLGIGGGAVIVPALVVLLGYGQHIAEGTSLAVIVPTAIVGAATHARRGYTEWALGWRLGAGGLFGAVLGATVALNLPGSVLSRAFAVLLLVVTVLLLRRRGRGGEDRDEPASRDEHEAPVEDRDDADYIGLRDEDPAGAAVTPGVHTSDEDIAGIRVEPLTPDRSTDFLAFFDDAAFEEDHPWAGCFCYFDRYPGPAEDFDPSDARTNRTSMQHLLDTGLVRGWLAYDEARPVGWCHATSRVELPHLKVDAPLPDAGSRVGVVACFTIAPTHQGRGIARLLLAAALDAFERQGMQAVEAYPAKDDGDPWRGPTQLFLAYGFEIAGDLGERHLLRRTLDGSEE